MFQSLKEKKNRIAAALVVPAAMLAGSAQAAVEATILDGVKTDITTVGGLIIGLAATAMGIRWVKATFF
ncbi:major capsid protein [Kistimonas asteriae]|uniref:major capsid protein n=1 Tax=Kistimonas asteriae TaxID=517724 RepID=UPI001BAA82F5|nr:major capsid protein [Kistimonas asteriae]